MRIFGVLLAAALVTLATGCGGKELLYETESSLLRATSKFAPQELATRGYRLAGQLSCGRQPGSAEGSIRVKCTGATSTRKPVIVLASVEQESEDEYFTILVDGQPVVENARCLAQECRRLKRD
jgi:hypothetical protein